MTEAITRSERTPYHDHMKKGATLKKRNLPVSSSLLMNVLEKMLLTKNRYLFPTMICAETAAGEDHSYSHI